MKASHILVAAGALALLTVPAFARGTLTLYSAPFFQGTSVPLDHPVRDLDRYSFNDRAQSARVNGGAWELCAANNFNGDCVTLTHDVRELKRYDMNRRANSARPAR